MDKNRQLNLALNHCSSFNLKKLKVDTLLLIVHNLLCDYEQINTNNISSNHDLNIDENEIKYISKSVTELRDYLENNIIVSQTMIHLFKNQNQSKVFTKIAKNLEPMRMYYKYLTSIFSAKLESGSHWIPELLAFSLIYNFKKEHEKSFINHPFIDNLPIDTILNIYNKNNIKIKKTLCEKNNTSSWRIKTNLDEMYDLSEFMIKKYLEYNYKINATRVSKTRVKRKK